LEDIVPVLIFEEFILALDNTFHNGTLLVLIAILESSLDNSTAIAMN
jgi:hypothetical protein